MRHTLLVAVSLLAKPCICLPPLNKSRSSLFPDATICSIYSLGLVVQCKINHFRSASFRLRTTKLLGLNCVRQDWNENESSIFSPPHSDCASDHQCSLPTALAYCWLWGSSWVFGTILFYSDARMKSPWCFTSDDIRNYYGTKKKIAQPFFSADALCLGMPPHHFSMYTFLYFFFHAELYHNVARWNISQPGQSVVVVFYGRCVKRCERKMKRHCCSEQIEWYERFVFVWRLLVFYS